VPLPGSDNPQSIPEQVTNAVASLRPFATEINVNDEWVTVPAYPAADWLELLMGDVQLYTIFPGLCDEEDQEYVEECLIAGAVSVSDIEDATLDLIETVSGRPWWMTLRIVAICQQRWGVIGTDMIIKGVDASKVSLAAWLDVAWIVMFNHLAEDKWTMFASQIETPPPQMIEAEPMETVEMSVDSFTSLMRG